MTDLREKVARLLLQRAYQESLDAGLLDDFTAKYHDRFFAHADAILSIARPAIIEECTAWQPIETALKDGQQVLLSEDGNIFIGEFDVHWSPEDGYRDGGAWKDLSGIHYNEPTHWMALPPPPLAKKP